MLYMKDFYLYCAFLEPHGNEFAIRTNINTSAQSSIVEVFCLLIHLELFPLCV